MDGGFGTVEELQAALGDHAYLADRGLSTAIHLALSLDKPLLLEVEIVRTRAPKVGELLARDVARAVARLRAMDLAKLPGVAETIDWANALAFLGADRLSPELARDTLGAVVKDHEDQELVEPRLV